MLAIKELKTPEFIEIDNVASNTMAASGSSGLGSRERREEPPSAWRIVHKGLPWSPPECCRVGRAVGTESSRGHQLFLEHAEVGIRAISLPHLEIQNMFPI